ncbi:MlaA family lipoprotein [Paraburkholderia caballeronis]|uniref:MlaA family lipoprotein n=1 Tax=Paraburkholderia caballeronis TaxID=416943 RepID=UPI001065A70C|nr:VacJ family lipoprotein [Paraburkholderia caballeronis]TDV05092.1 phospholipid-binding lipoprotein MlaA [Paraburkholderia caballeronis]TDV08213.1 phospholipid-binding lipoprotein MlaA [Paraburkholderia caballeronis]TDV19219.1 phospholipid-binding lipoprotein MlaA [Paraburkholderia caballeronis]TDV24725.1 phospholipid-binding lipoprotein MlaA [Paraburkholderia caballeronis]
MKNHKAAMATAAACLTLLTAGCATGPDRKPGDPLEPMNRVIFKVNDTVDRTIAQPVAKGYQKVTPEPLRQAITNFFSNLGDVSNFANSVLQLKATEAAESLMRIVMNTTFGLGGLLDFATEAGLPKHHEDFGLTLGRYGIPAGPYLVLPLFGPSSVRDGIGMGVDVKFNVLNYIDPPVRNPLYVTQFVSARADMLGATDLLQQAALDKYSFVRDAYRQQREALLRGGSGASTPLPDYGDPGDGGDSGTDGAANGTSGANGANAAGGAAGAEAGAGAAAAAGAAGAVPAAGSAAPASEPAATPAGASEPAAPGAASAPSAASAPAAKAPAQSSGSGAAQAPAPASAPTTAP